MQAGLCRHFIANLTLASLFLFAPSLLSAQGVAFGTQPDSSQYRDSIAVLGGTWGPDQTATATVRTANQPSPSGAVFEEVELLLRFSIGANSAAGYEVNFSCAQGYTQIVRWNGAAGDFTLLDSRSVPPLVTGDQVKATIVGSTITTYINNVAIFSVTDATYASGGPGMAFYREGGNVDMNGDYGFTSYAATSPATSRTYTTSFPSTENPISEGGKWINGGATGVDWNNVQTIVTTPRVVTTPFTSFTARLEIDRSHRPTIHAADSFEVEGSVVLGAASHGIAPDAENVTLSLGPFSLAIPAGSFVKKRDHDHDDRGRGDHDRYDRGRFYRDHDDRGRGGHHHDGRQRDHHDRQAEYVFKGVINGVSLEATIDREPGRKFTFSFEGHGAGLSGVVNPVIVGLAIGDDLGSVVVRARIE